MKLIACADGNWGIGLENRLLFHIPEDMRFFRRMTEGKAVLMGRKTMESLPGGKPLKNRENFVLTRDPDFEAEGFHVLCGCTAEEILHTLPDDTFVIGGAEVYREFLDYCTDAYITRVHAKVRADTYMPDLDALPDWHPEETVLSDSDARPAWEIVRYTRRRGAPADMDYDFPSPIRRAIAELREGRNVLCAHWKKGRLYAATGLARDADEPYGPFYVVYHPADEPGTHYVRKLAEFFETVPRSGEGTHGFRFWPVSCHGTGAADTGHAG